MKNFIGGLAFQKLLQGILHQTLCQNLRRVVRSRFLPFTSGKAIDESAFFIHTELAAIFPGFVADALVLGVLAKPFTDDDVKTALRLSEVVDELWEQVIALRREIGEKTSDPLTVYGQPAETAASHTTIREKDMIYKKLYLSEEMKNAGPYARLKFAMDYWCALWFWPIEKAELLPTRSEFLADMGFILEGTIDTFAAVSKEIKMGQLSMFPSEAEQLVMDMTEQYSGMGVVDIPKLCQQQPRLALVRQIAEQNHFMHWELEFADLFAERGGFDLVIGNPPWILLGWNEQDLLADYNPQFAIREFSASDTARLRTEELSKELVRHAYVTEYTSISGMEDFYCATQNYCALAGMKTNLYKCFLPQAWSFGTGNGVSAFVHPEGIYDDPKGGELRKQLYPRLKRHYQFRNELKLFTEVHHSRVFSLNVYSNHTNNGFDSINNLFAPATIDECYENESGHIAGIKDHDGNWNISGSLDRILKISKNELAVFGKIFDAEADWQGTKMLALHSKQLLHVVSVLANQQRTIGNIEGIILKAILRRKDEESAIEEANEEKPRKQKYQKMVYEYSRSAASAISEFAPMNSFYVDGRKLTIDQVDLTTAQTELWRLCPNCSHAQQEVHGQAVAACPQCGSPAWADSGQLRSMLKVHMVYSNDDWKSSLIGDDSDDRSTVFYTKQMLVDVDEAHDISKAYRMDNDEFPFGYEFVRKATMREINFGESDMVGERLMVAGTEDVRKGFKICKHCGKIQPANGKPEHTYTCKAKNAPAGSDDPYEECLFLYREFATEALRILIPATTMDSTTVRLESFTAAFMLGMKERFGNVDHLRATVSEVPVADADYRKQYLVIYDSVPGGTGYLKQLMQRQDSLVDIFEKALRVLENCTCKDDPQKDGCYHCLYAYRQSNQIGQISRKTAISLLKAIISGKDNIEEIPMLGNIPVNSLFESELERRFIEALDRIHTESGSLNPVKALVNGKEGYRMKVGDTVWEIEPQVVLDASSGVSVTSRADFVLWPVREAGNRKPVVIFTDGFQYHKDRVADDTLKREAILRSGRCRTDMQKLVNHIEYMQVQIRQRLSMKPQA